MATLAAARPTSLSLSLTLSLSIHLFRLRGDASAANGVDCVALAIAGGEWTAEGVSERERERKQTGRKWGGRAGGGGRCPPLVAAASHPPLSLVSHQPLRAPQPPPSSPSAGPPAPSTWSARTPGARWRNMNLH